MLIFQVRLYRFSLSNIQTYDNTNNLPKIHFPYPSSNEYYNVFQGHTTDYMSSNIANKDKYSNYDMDRCNRILNDDRHRYYSNTTSPNRDRYSFPYQTPNIREIDPSKRQSHPKPFRSSSSAGALLGQLNETKELSPSTEYSRKPVHNLGKGQYYKQGVNGYTSMPSMNNNNNNINERRNKAQALVVGKSMFIRLNISNYGNCSTSLLCPAHSSIVSFVMLSNNLSICMEGYLSYSV